jgi:xanthine/CO dehydrogenase XdhC/CoxF family maturation factor
VIGGAMPDAEPIARLALGLDWRVRVLDHREERLARFDVPGVERLAGEPATLAAHVAGDAFTAALVMYHAEAADGEAVRALVETPPGFVGVLGPRARTARLLAGTPFAGTSPAAAPWPAWLRAPVGLDLGADTPDEIAVSVIGELLAWQRGTGGAPLVGRDGPLHATGSLDVLEGTPAPWPGDSA